MSDKSDHCVYRRLDNGVHKFIFKQATKQAADEYITHLEKILSNHPEGNSLLFLVDLSPQGLPPMRHAVIEGKRFFSRFEQPPKMRAAFLYKGNVLLGVAEALINLIRLNTERRAFRLDEEGEAMRWLTEMGAGV